jgi:restriction endonuclease S subunit
MTQPPAGWHLGPLSDFIDSRSGNGKLIKGKQSPVKAPELFPGFSASGQDIWVEVAEHSGPGIVVSAVGARCGKTFMAHGEWTAVANTHVMQIRDGAPLDIKFLWYLCNDENWWIRSGTAQPFVKVKDTLQRDQLIPPIDEQHKIVEILEDHLSRLDAALADVKQAKLKAAQFRRSLLQAGVTGNFNNGTKDAESGLPAGWEIKTLADVADWASGGTPSSKDSTLYGGGVPWIVIGDLTEALVFETEKTISQQGLDSSSAKLRPAGTVMVAMYGASIGRTGIMGKDMSTNQAIACGIPRSDKILGQYLLYFLQSQKQEFVYAGKGGAQPNISQSVVKSWPIPLPPLDQQRDIVDEIDNQLAHLLRANESSELLVKKSTSFRRSLLQAAFTGQLTNEVAGV